MDCERRCIGPNLENAFVVFRRPVDGKGLNLTYRASNFPLDGKIRTIESKPPAADKISTHRQTGDWQVERLWCRAPPLRIRFLESMCKKHNVVCHSPIHHRHAPFLAYVYMPTAEKPSVISKDSFRTFLTTIRICGTSWDRQNENKNTCKNNMERHHHFSAQYTVIAALWNSHRVTCWGTG